VPDVGTSTSRLLLGKSPELVLVPTRSLKIYKKKTICNIIMNVSLLDSPEFIVLLFKNGTLFVIALPYDPAVN
jgi:hypothetical protein